MNRDRYYLLRHHLRASGWEWNGGSKLAVQDASRYSKRSLRYGGKEHARTKDIALVAGTLSTGYEGVWPGTLLEDWIKYKNGSYSHTTRTWWKNLMRANVRQDKQLFTEQLTVI